MYQNPSLTLYKTEDKMWSFFLAAQAIVYFLLSPRPVPTCGVSIRSGEEGSLGRSRVVS